MFSVDISSEPGLPEWGHYVDSSILSEQYNTFKGTLGALSREFNAPNKLKASNIYNLEWKNDILQSAASTSRLMFSSTYSREYLSFWEAYSVVIIPWATGRLLNRPYKLSTFHMLDTTAAGIQCFGKVISRIDREKSIHLEWMWVGTFYKNHETAQLKDKTRWLECIDCTSDDTKPTSADLRSWLNKTGKTKVDLVISCDKHTSSTGIIFALLRTSKGGAALIKINKITSLSMAAVIHLFSRCFTTAKLIHCEISNDIYLFGAGFTPIPTKFASKLFEIVDNITGDSSPFSPMYIQGDLFNTTLKLIVDYNKILYKYRLDYYEKLLHRCSTLSKSSSSKLFSGYISDAINDIYPNKDKEWVTRTSFES